MADLFLELFSEEIPARMQAAAIEHLRKKICDELKKAGLQADVPTETFVTPRRLAVWIKELPTEQAATETELKGPKVGAPDAAMQGFLKKSGLTQANLVERDGVWFATVKKEGQQTATLLKTIIEDTLTTFPWPKSMRWGAGSTTWVRPLHAILCLFDNKIIPITFAGITASNTTHGHRFLSPARITITTPAEYEPALAKAHVIAHRDKRKATIIEQAQKAAAAAKLTLKSDEFLLEEVTGLVEYPTILCGTIDAKFMDLPKEVLVSEMRAHQKYFALENADGTLSSKFLITANITATDGGKAIIAGNERVLRARLSDGRFFWDQDRKKSLADWAENLKTVTFHAKLGTIADKVARIATLADAIATAIGADKNKVATAATLAKADLTTGMVGEFPELQGVMGRYYAQAAHEDAAVADAIRDHYKPQGPGDDVPSEKTAICVALADKLDTLVSMFAIGEKPTGSKDPFALRRSALGVIRIILENKLRLPLSQFFAVPVQSIALRQAHSKLAQKTAASLQHSMDHKVGIYLTVNETAHQDLAEAVPQDLSTQLLDFFIDRLKVQLKDQGFRHDVINAVTASGDDDFLRIVTRAQALQDFLATEDGKILLAGYVRASGILSAEEKKDKKPYVPYSVDELQAESFSEAEEKSLKDALVLVISGSPYYLEIGQYYQALQTLIALCEPVEKFFTNILVNSDNSKIRETRLRLLATIRYAMDQVVPLRHIEG